ncbi:IclR family transcriptional regulator [Cucumibacter marinus]|uniref:IclR family transcriptional regulator n=1 Tax=Cucumibacter marinus TaxID=1121252 RepID=UPI0004082F3D|nr:IclR family transcriptional regulator [Cucumibacter marinus]
MTEDNNKASQDLIVPPVHRAAKLLRYIGDGNRCQNLSTAARQTGLNRTTLLRLLNTLAIEHLIEPIPDGGGYRLGVGLISLAAEALYSRDVIELARPVLQSLADEMGLSAHLGVMAGSEIIYLLRATPDVHLVSNVQVGSRMPSHAVTIGRALLASMDDAEIRDALRDVEFVKVSDQTPMSIEGVLEQAHRDRSLGQAWSLSAFEKGLGSCAQVVRDHTGRAVAAINVAGPEGQFSATGGKRDRIASAVEKAAARISGALGFTGAAGKGQVEGGHGER